MIILSLIPPSPLVHCGLEKESYSPQFAELFLQRRVNPVCRRVNTPSTPKKITNLGWTQAAEKKINFKCPTCRRSENAFNTRLGVPTEVSLGH